MRREQQKQARMSRAMDAAESLIRRDGSTDFTMLELADLADVSPATPFNLFGSKSGLLYALLNRCMDIFYELGDGAAAEHNPFERALAVTRAVACHFANDPDFYRPLLQHLVGVADPEHRPAYLNRGIEVWHIALDGLESAGKLPGHINREHLSRVMVSHFLGVLDLWAQGELSDRELPDQAEYGLSLVLMSVANQQERRFLDARIDKLHKKLPQKFSHPSEPARLKVVSAQRDT